MPIQVTVQQRGLKEVRKGLENLRAAVPKVATSRMRAAAEDIVDRMQDYPPERPKQKYKRTFLFRKSWKITKTASGNRVSNTATRKGKHYPPFVVGTATQPDAQAWMHKGRWKLFAAVVNYVVSKLPKLVQDHVYVVTKNAFKGT